MRGMERKAEPGAFAPEPLPLPFPLSLPGSVIEFAVMSDVSPCSSGF